MFKCSRIPLSQLRNVFRQQNYFRASARCYANTPEEIQEQEEYSPKKRLVLSGERSINKVTLMGRVGADAELRGTDSRPVVTFSVATNDRYASPSGEITSVAEWHRVAVFRNGLRDVVLDRAKKGTRVYLTGALKYSLYKGNDGNMQRGSNIIADDVIVISQKEATQDEAETEY